MINKIKEYLGILGNAFSVLCLTSIGYLIYYYYKLGYYSYFGIPSYFIDFSLQNILFVFTTLASFSIVIIYVYQRIRTEFKIITKGSFLTFSVFLISLGIITFTDFHINSLLVACAVISYMIIGLGLYKLRNKRILKYFKIPLLFKEIESITFTDIVFIFLAVISIIFIFWTIGFKRAEDNSYNTISIKEATYIVVDQFSNNLLVLPINIQTKIVRRRLYVYKIENLSLDKSPLILNTTKVTGTRD